MKNINLILYIILIILFTQSLLAESKSIEPKKIIYETDMCLDVDDVGAIAVLHALENQGECEILAVCFNEVHEYGPSAIDAINTWYGRGDIPIGIYRGSLKNPDWSGYLEQVAQFPHDLENDDTPSALDVYTQTLSEQPDSSVTIISVGFLNNLYDLLKAEPDLVAQKVKELVFMGGEWDDNFNLVRHNTVNQAEYVIRNWPSSMVISQAGGSIHTGTILENSPKENPVREAYYRFFGQKFEGRPSWDQMAVLYGVRGLSTYFRKKTSGSCRLSNGFQWELDSKSRFALNNKLANSSYERIIETFMAQYPIGARFLVSSSNGWLPFEVNFDASASVIAGSPDGVQYQWDFGDGSIGEGKQVTHTYTSIDTFDVQLIVVSEQGDSLFAFDQIVTDDPLFSPVEYFGTMDNYDFNQIELWSTTIDEDDMKMNISNKERDPNVSLPGICLIKDSIYTNFSLNLIAKTGEDLETEPLSDYMLIFGYVDDENYKYIIMKETTSRVVVVKNGVGVSLIWTPTDGIPDEEYHKVELIGQDEVFTLMLDDEEFLTSDSDKLSGSGRIGFGSTKYAAYFDEIDVERLQSSNVAVESSHQILPSFRLFNNYPNPFNPETNIKFEIPKSGVVEVSVYDIKGQKVKTIIREHKSCGIHEVAWDGKNSNGLDVPSGIYFAKLKSGEFSQFIKLNLVR